VKISWPDRQIFWEDFNLQLPLTCSTALPAGKVSAAINEMNNEK
jgi:hypothetical protein